MGLAENSESRFTANEVLGAIKLAGNLLYFRLVISFHLGTPLRQLLRSFRIVILRERIVNGIPLLYVDGARGSYQSPVGGPPPGRPMRSLHVMRLIFQCPFSRTYSFS